MQEQFVPYGLAVRLKEINFHENCMAYFFKGGKINNYFNKYYNNNKLAVIQPFAFHCTAPLWQQAFDWFRKNYNLEVILSPDSINLPEKYLREYKIISTDESIVLEKVCDQKYWIRKGCFKSYEESRQACLEKLIKIVENEKV